MVKIDSKVLKVVEEIEELEEKVNCSEYVGSYGKSMDNEKLEDLKKKLSEMCGRESWLSVIYRSYDVRRNLVLQ